MHPPSYLATQARSIRLRASRLRRDAVAGWKRRQREHFCDAVYWENQIGDLKIWDFEIF